MRPECTRISPNFSFETLQYPSTQKKWMDGLIDGLIEQENRKHDTLGPLPYHYDADSIRWEEDCFLC